ncbi:MAG: sigma-70 family RNA polymerase sigma factor [Bacteroidales bacterium]|nr:sigma-70 family RNA polymerase sigma factor [Bacteroidales bacterium]
MNKTVADRETLFTSLLIRNHSMLWRMCWRRSGKDTDCCKDLMQEVAIDIWNNLDKLRPDATPSQERAWVGWRARSVFFRIGRTRQLPTEPLTDEIANSVVADESHRLAEILEGCMSSLSDGERQMMQLYLDGYNAEEIGQQIGVSRDAVYQRMHRAINKMRYSVLVLLLLLAAGATAIAIVPPWNRFFGTEWGRFFGHGDEDHDALCDTSQIQTLGKHSVALPPSDTAVAAATAVPEKRTQRISIESLPVIDVLQMLPSQDTIWVADIDSRLTLSFNGDDIIIAGKTGESIKIYDMNGNMVASGVADGLCILNPFPMHSLVLHLTDYYFRLKIGNREEILLVL